MKKSHREFFIILRDLCLHYEVDLCGYDDGLTFGFDKGETQYQPSSENIFDPKTELMIDIRGSHHSISSEAETDDE